MEPSARPRPADIVIPFYRNARLVAPLFESIIAAKDELAALDCSVVVIDDSPDDTDLDAALRLAVAGLPPGLSCTRIDHSVNEGFVRSANAGLRMARERRHDAVLLNSDTLILPGAIAEMRRVAYIDPMIGFVSPRSNHATICSLPHQEDFGKASPAEAYRNFSLLAPHLRDFQFIPVGVGFCLFIKLEVIAELGLLDEAYGEGYDEENDLMMRANRCGYRAALANHAFIYHFGGSSFAQAPVKIKALQQRNRLVLRERYPEYHPTVSAYAAGAQFQAEEMLSALLPDPGGRTDMVFDLSSLGPHYNGTVAAAKALLLGAVEQWKDFFNVHLMASEEAVKFHGLDKLPATVVPIGTTRTFALALRWGQPFEWQQMARLSNLAVVNVYAMQDPISVDCLYLNFMELDALWAGVFGYADAVIYISDFVAEQFRRRFRMRPGLREMVSYLSLDLRDYAPPEGAEPCAGDHILIVGNAFEHKYVKPTAEALHRAFPKTRIVALGLDKAIQGVTQYGSGYLPEATVKSLLRKAMFVVFPSTYEGFGIPVLESLAYRKPILARDIPVTRAVQAKLRDYENLILYTCTEDLIGRLASGFPVWQEPAQTFAREGKPHDWAAITDEIGQMCKELLAEVAVEEVLVPRLEYFRFLAPGAGQAAPNVTALALALRNCDTQIEDLRNSWSWRLTAPMRALADTYLRLTRKNAPAGPRSR